MNFSVRAPGPELLDDPRIPFPDIRVNMEELDLINRYLGGHAITRQGISRLAPKVKQLHICEIGCGGGDNLQAVARWAAKKGVHCRFTGIDINPHCLEVCSSRIGANPDWQLIRSDYAEVHFENEKPDIIFSSLFCHHFQETALPGMIAWMRDNSRIGFFINDLHRHWLAYHSIRWLTRIFSRSYLVKHDAPLSVARGFSRKELANLLPNNMETALHWKWAFRWLLTAKHVH